MVYQLICKRKGYTCPEPEKIAIESNFWTAFAAGIIHVVPVLTTIVLLILNIQGYYIGAELDGPSGQDGLKLLGLQFAAKIHELTFTASLTAVVFSYLRHELAVASGLPFGAIFAGFQFDKISFLWSSEFWGITYASSKGSWRRWKFLLLVVPCCLLSVGVAPLSASLMKPRLDWWPAGGTNFWIAMGLDELTSLNVNASQVSDQCSTDNGDPTCPHADWKTIAENYMAFWPDVRVSGLLPRGFYMPSAKSTRYMAAVSRSPYWQYSDHWTVATVSSSSVADGLSEMGRLWVLASTKDLVKGAWGVRRFWSNFDVIFHVSAKQPVVQVRCVQRNLSSLVANDSKSSIDVEPLAFYNLSDKSWDGSNFTSFVPQLANEDSVASLLQTANSSSRPQLIWTSIGEGNSSSLAAVLSVPADDRNDAVSAQVYACTLDARVAPVSMETTQKAPLYVRGYPHGTHETSKGIYSFGNLQTNNMSFPRINIDPEWASYLNPGIGSANTTAFNTILEITGLWNSTQTPNLKDSVYAVEAIFATMVVNGLARRDFGTALAGELLGNQSTVSTLLFHEDGEVPKTYTFEDRCGTWCQHILPSYHKSLGYGSSIFNISDVEKARSTKFTMQAEAQGYAYAYRGATTMIAMIGLSICSVIVLSHWVCLMWFKESSSSWDSISELVALAVSSTPSPEFANTGAGIQSIGIFGKETKVVDRDGHLELSFGASKEPFCGVQANKYYA